MILVNFKTYDASSTKKATSLAHKACDVSNDSKVEIVVCPQAVDLKEVVEASDHEVWAQHVDYFERGRATGWFPAEVAKELGATGTLLNHSEHKLDYKALSRTVVRCREIGLKVVVLAGSVDEAKRVSGLKPDFIGYEPPELVGSKTTSVARSKPEVIEKVVKAIPNIPILVGAGIKDSEDVRISLQRGAIGIIPSSAVVLAVDPEAVLQDLAGGFKK